MAPLVLLSRPAPARVVAADLTLGARRGLRLACDRRHCASLLRRTIPAGAVGAIGLGGAALQDLPHQCRRRRRRRITLDLHPEYTRHDRRLYPLAQLGEPLEGFVLVLDERVTLAVGAEPDPFAQVLHLGQVLHPLPVSYTHLRAHETRH